MVKWSAQAIFYDRMFAAIAGWFTEGFDRPGVDHISSGR
jgi:hypothetical protein